MARILVSTTPAAGHLFPLVPGLLELQRRGHEVHLRVGEKLLATARAAGLAASPADPAIAAIEVNDYAPGKATDKLRKGIHELLARGPLERADMERAIAEHDPELIIVDGLVYGGTVAAEASGRRWAVAQPSLLPLPGKGIPPYGMGLAPLRGPLGRVRDFLGWRLVEHLYGRSMLPKLNELRASAGLPALRSPIDQVRAPDRILCMTGDPLEYPRTDTHEKVRFVGGQLWDPPAEHGDLSWLDEPGDPWVLVTCSTDYQADERLAVTAVEALRDEPIRVVLTLADAYDNVTLPPASNVRAERFLPHGPVLERAAAVVCHSGMGIVQKAMAAGVPIAAVPFGRDQPEVARRVVEAGAGVQLAARKLTPERLRAMVRKAVTMRPGAQAAGARLRAAGGGERFADAAEELVSEKMAVVSV
jgi:UDP:flavonoid glycosyltransferase YjiC (YdhE family)